MEELFGDLTKDRWLVNLEVSFVGKPSRKVESSILVPRGAGISIEDYSTLIEKEVGVPVYMEDYPTRTYNPVNRFSTMLNSVRVIGSVIDETYHKRESKKIRYY